MQLSEKHFTLFRACNDAASVTNNHWIHRQKFYAFKNRVLRTMATQDGFDLQIIRQYCYSCRGTGVYNAHGYGPNRVCRNCDHGIYSIYGVILRRYILNDIVFHEPIARATTQGIYLDEKGVRQQPEFKSILEGHVKHEKPVLNPTYALAVLYWHYDRIAFVELVKWYADQTQTRAKAKFRMIMCKAKNQLEGIGTYLGVINKQQYIETDDLPF